RGSDRNAVTSLAVAVVVAAGLVASAGPQRIAVVASAGVDDAARAAVEKNVKARDDVSLVDPKAVDDAVKALHDAGIDCGAFDTACYVKLGLEGDFDVV